MMKILIKMKKLINLLKIHLNDKLKLLKKNYKEKYLVKELKFF